MEGYGWNAVRFYQWGWPDEVLYPKQVEILESLERNIETVVPAGHMLGKDYISGFAVLWFFMTREPCRIITTSVDATQLQKVLWGELRNFINTCTHKLPLIVLNDEIKKKVIRNGVPEISDKSYVIARVAKKGEGMTGHHLDRGPNGEPHVLGVFDESSGIDHETYSRLDTCSHRNLIIGNPYECENFFKWGVMGRPGSKDKGGDIPDGHGNYLRKVIHISGDDSPNVQYAIKEILEGKRKPEPILILQEDQPWGVYSQKEYDALLKQWEK